MDGVRKLASNEPLVEQMGRNAIELGHGVANSDEGKPIFYLKYQTMRKKGKTMGDIPGHVFPRKLQKPLPMADRAKGLEIVDTDGRRYLDASGGATVLNVGHGRKEVARAVCDQIIQCDYAHPGTFTNSPVEELAKALAGHAPPGIDRFYFLSGGSEATETAIKLARQIQLEYGHPQRTQLIARPVIINRHRTRRRDMDAGRMQLAVYESHAMGGHAQVSLPPARRTQPEARKNPSAIDPIRSG